MTFEIKKRPIVAPKEAANRASIESLLVSVSELSGAIGTTPQRAIRVGELLEAGILQLSPDGQLVRAGSVPDSEDVGPGTVTSVQINNATGLTFTGGPITSSGAFTPALSANLLAWHALAPTAKVDAHRPATGDWDTYIDDDVGSFFHEASGAANQPAAGFNWSGITLPGFNGNNANQLAVANSLTAPHMYVRGRVGAVQGSWLKMPFDSEVVHITGNEVIGGGKTFSADVVIQKTIPRLYLAPPSGVAHANAWQILANVSDAVNGGIQFFSGANLTANLTAAGGWVGGVATGSIQWRTSADSQIFIRDNGVGNTTIDAVNAVNSAYKPLHFTALSYTFNGGAVAMASPLNLPANGLLFGAALGQHVNLYGTAYGQGIQNSTQYFRSGAGGGFAWFVGGAHATGANDPGGGLLAAYMTTTGVFNAVELTVGGDVAISLFKGAASGISTRGDFRVRGLIYNLSANLAAWIRVPRTFVQSADPGAQSSDGDLWAW